MKDMTNSRRLLIEAQQFLPGGVDSPVRAFKAVGGFPPFMVRGKGSRLFDVDGNEYIDFVCSWGPLILGHSPPTVNAALKKAVDNGTSFGAATELEIIMARLVNRAFPSMEMLRFVSSGTEATMSAIRLARAFTNRDMILKFDGGYHGHSDSLLVKAGSGVATFGLPDSPGVPASFARETVVAPYNNLPAVTAMFKANPGRIAAIIVEPVAANMGVVNPAPGFLKGLRDITESSGALLIFDEVISGFRLDFGGAQALFGIKPDLTCLGKIIGGGLPVGAYGGRRDIMQMISPLGPVYQAGTLSGNPLAMTAGIETIKELSQSGIYEELETKSYEFGLKLNEEIKKSGVKARVNRAGSLLTIFFTDQPVTDYASARKSDTVAFAKFFQGLLSRGIYWPPSQFEAAFLSLAHTDADLEIALKAIGESLAVI